jgi:hypothetical protein
MSTNYSLICNFSYDEWTAIFELFHIFKILKFNLSIRFFIFWVHWRYIGLIDRINICLISLFSSNYFIY